MKLYYTPGACSLASHIALCEAGLSFDLVKVDLKEKKTDEGRDFLAINYKGYIPALEINSGEVITEGIVILQYIADQKPESKLAPAYNTMERVRLQEWLVFISTELHKNFSGLFYAQNDAEWKKFATDKLTMRFSLINDQLKNKTFLMGDQFTVADCYLFTVLRWCVPTKFDLSSYPEINAYQQRVAQRTAVQTALKSEGLN